MPANTLLFCSAVPKIKGTGLSVTNANKQVYAEIFNVSIYFGVATMKIT